MVGKWFQRCWHLTVVEAGVGDDSQCHLCCDLMSSAVHQVDVAGMLVAASTVFAAVVPGH